jgi:hypothetical protein
LASWDDFLRQAPQSDDAIEYLTTHPKEWSIPFGDRLRQLISGTLAPLEPTSELPYSQANVGTSVANIMLPTVSAAASVRWSRMLNPEPPRVTLEDRNDATIADTEGSAQIEEDNRRKRLKSDVLLRYRPGTIVYVPATSWSEYKRRWPYNDVPIEKAFVQGSVDDLCYVHTQCCITLYDIIIYRRVYCDKSGG